MFNKILISGEIELLTGMHIGTGGEFSAIGAVDSPVVRDVITNMPILPGSSFKGKIRTLLDKTYSFDGFPNSDDERIIRLFGSTDKPSRLIFSDMLICNEDELRDYNIYSTTEVKFENNISRLSGIANPRQIERVIRGSKFKMELIYNLENENEYEEDIKLLVEGLNLLQYDYIGGHGSRGYGKVKINNLKAEEVVGNIDNSIIEKINALCKDVK